MTSDTTRALPVHVLNALNEIEAAERGHTDPIYTVSFDDELALKAVVDVLDELGHHLNGGTVEAQTDAEYTFERWWEERLAEVSEGSRLVAALYALLFPFADPVQAVAYVDASSASAIGLEQNDGYLALLERIWGGSAARAASGASFVPSGALVGRRKRLILAAAGVCSMPAGAISFLLDAKSAQRFCTAAAQCAIQISRLVGPMFTVQGPAGVGLDTQQSLERLLARRIQHLQVLSNEIGESAPSVPPSNRVFADGHAGALFELRGVSIELRDELDATVIPKHRFSSPLSRLGLTDPIEFDQNPRLQRLKDLQRSSITWLDAALRLAGDGAAATDLDRPVRRIALALGAAQTLLSMVQVSEEVADQLNDYRLWEQLEPLARNLESAISFLELDLVNDSLADSIEKDSSNASLIAKNFLWSRLVLAAAVKATEFMMLIETAKRMRNTRPPVMQPAGTQAGFAATRILSGQELAQILAGITVYEAAATGGQPQKGRRRGLRAEKGLGLSPNRPRTSIESLTDSATKRIPDHVTKGWKSFWEVKNVLRLRLTPQMVDFLLYAQASGRRLVLYVRPTVTGATRIGTTLSPSLKQAINVLRAEGLIEIRYLKIF